VRYRERRYRNWISRDGLLSFRVQVKETDLLILAEKDLRDRAKEEVIQIRQQLEEYIRENPSFGEALRPLPPDPLAPPLIGEMYEASRACGVGPMAAVAGAVAEAVGRSLASDSEEVIVENGGDIYLRVKGPCRVGIFAGKSPLSMKVGLMIPPERTPLGVCTSSGSVGPSLSMGRADAVCVVARSAALADAAATFLGNMVRDEKDVKRALQRARGIQGIEGTVIIVGETLGVWGDYPLVRI